MHIFEYSEITVSVPSDIVDTLLDIERIRAFDGLRIKQYSKELAVAADVSASKDLASVNRMEFIPMPHTRLGELRSGSEPADDRERFALGCIHALDGILEDPNAMEVNERSLLHIHRTVTNGTTKRESRFRYRESQESAAMNTHMNAIRPLRPEDVRSAVNQMAESYEVADGIGIRSILLAPCMVLDFLNIQPFSEANWQIARLMLKGLLLKGGFEAIRYIPFESVIEERSEEYYESVSEASDGWRNNTNDPYQFVRFIAEAVLECYRLFETRYPLKDGCKRTKAERIELLFMSDPGVQLSKSDVCEQLPDISRRTADPVITNLVESKKIVKVGSFKDASYKKM